MKAVAWIIVFALASLSSVAHLDAGFDAPIGEGYVLDFGYSPAEIIAGEAAAMAFNLLDSAGNSSDFDSVWVRILSSEKVLFAGDFAPKNSNVALSYVFQSPGKYTISAVVEKEGKPLGGSDFNVDVAGNQRSSQFMIVIGFAIILALIVTNLITYKVNLFSRK